MAPTGSPPDGVAPPQVFLRPIGSSLTLGLSGLAVASVVESGLDLRWIAPSQRHEVGLALLSIPFVLQLIACVFAYLARDGAAGAALGLQSGTWLALGLSHITTVPPYRSGAIGLVLLASGGLLLCTAGGVSLLKPLPAAIFALAAARFALSGIYQLGGGGTWRHATGIVGLVICGLAIYGVLAFELEGEMHRPLLPTFRRSAGRTAIQGDAQAQVQDVFNEAGVRQTT